MLIYGCTKAHFERRMQINFAFHMHFHLPSFHMISLLCSLAFVFKIGVREEEGVFDYQSGKSQGKIRGKCKV